MADVTNDQPATAWWWHPTVVGPLLACLVLAAIGGYIGWNDWRTEKAESERRTQEFTCAILLDDGVPQSALPSYCDD